MDAHHVRVVSPGAVNMSPSTTSASSIVPARVGRVLLIICWLTVVYGMAGAVPHLPSVRGIGAWVSTLIFLGTFSFAVTRPTTAAAILLPAGLAGVVMQLLAPNNGAFVAVVAVIAVAGLRLESQSSRTVATLAGGGFLVASMMSAHPLSPAEVIATVPAFLFAHLGSTATRSLRTEQQRTTQLLAEVIAGRDARIRAAALDERAALARDMHDVLAHTLSALSIHLEGTRLLAAQSSCDPSVISAVERASSLAREGLGEARRAVGSLRGETLLGPDLLAQLAAEFERYTGVPCHFLTDGTLQPLSAAARLAFYRVAQEALTNVQKHADATVVDITLRHALNGVELTVENVGVPLVSPLEGGGYGLRGMRERAELFHGTLETGPTVRGFRVCLWIPAPQSDQSAS